VLAPYWLSGWCFVSGRPRRFGGAGWLVSGLARRFSGMRAACPHATAFAFDLDDDGMMEQSVEQGGGDNRIAEDLAQFGEAAVRRSRRKSRYTGRACLAVQTNAGRKPVPRFRVRYKYIRTVLGSRPAPRAMAVIDRPCRCSSRIIISSPSRTIATLPHWRRDTVDGGA